MSRFKRLLSDVVKNKPILKPITTAESKTEYTKLVCYGGIPVLTYISVALECLSSMLFDESSGKGVVNNKPAQTLTLLFPDLAVPIPVWQTKYI